MKRRAKGTPMQKETKQHIFSVQNVAQKRARKVAKTFFSPTSNGRSYFRSLGGIPLKLKARVSFLKADIQPSSKPNDIESNI